MKLFWVVLTHGLLVSGRYIRERREAGNATVEEPKIRARNARFAIDDKYPYNDKIVLKKEVTVSFNCSSTKPWWVWYM